MTKHNILIFAFLPFFAFGDCADCEAYKTQVVNDCNALDSSLQTVANNVNSASGFATSGYNSSTDPNDKAIFSTIISTLSNTQGYINSVSAFVSSIRSTALSLQCFTNTVGGSCDCAQYLQTLIGLVQTCNQTVVSVKSGVDSLVSSIGTVGPDDSDIVSTVNAINNTFDDLASYIEEFLSVDGGELPYTISDFYTMLSSITNSFTDQNIYYNFTDVPERRFPMFRLSTSGVVQSPVFYTVPSSFLKINWRSVPFATSVKYALQYLILQQVSHLNLSYSNTIAIATIARKMDNLTNTVDISSITNFLEEKFTIFNPSSPLQIYTPGSEQNYYQFLTNYYIKVSTGGNLSPSEPHTNWFSRIEMLLASLVFKDDGTNFVDNADNTSQMEDTLSQSVDTLSQAVSLPQNVTGKIDNMGQSFLGLLEEWRTIVSGNSLPSQFVLCDINLTSQNPDSSSNSSLSSFRLETSLDSGEFRQFLDFCHAITTILFTMLFVWLSIFLLSFSLASLAKLAKFCYMVYSALFGG